MATNVTAENKGRVSSPVVNPMARDRLQQLIRRTMAPHTVETILASAINGNLKDQALVFVAMLDTWPRLQKAISEVANRSAAAPYMVKPCAARGAEPTPGAIAMADFVEDSLFSLRPDPARHECDLEGLAQSLAYGYYTGHAVAEIYYHANGMVKSFANVGAEYYAYPRDYNEPDRLMLNPSGHYNGALEDFDNYPNKFLVGIHKGHVGHASIAATMRSLVQWWLGGYYGIKWLMEFTQSFGSPIRWATYPAGDMCAMNLVSDMLANMGMLSWGAFPEGTNLEIKESSRSAGDLPQKALIEMADRQADILILGQSLTTDVADSGSRALGAVHHSIRHDAIDAVVQWTSKIFTHQLVPAVMRASGAQNLAEVPAVKVDWPECEDEKAKAERDEILFAKLGAPVSANWFYERHGIPKPEPGDTLLEMKAPKPVASPPGAQPEDADPANGELTPVEAKRANAPPARVLQRPIVDELTDNVMQNLSGEAAVFLGGIRPVFRRLTGLALDGSVTDKDFIEALQKAADTMPEMFELLDVGALQTAMENAIGTGMLAGVGERIIT